MWQKTRKWTLRRSWRRCKRRNITRDKEGKKMTIRQENENAWRSRKKSRPWRCRYEDETGIRGSYGREIDDNIKEEETEKEIRNKESFFHVTSKLLLFWKPSCQKPSWVWKGYSTLHWAGKIANCKLFFLKPESVLWFEKSIEAGDHENMRLTGFNAFP